MMFDPRRVSLRETLFAAAMLCAAGAIGCGDDGAGNPSPPVDAGPGPGAGFQDPAAAFPTKTPIKHLIVIFGENVSFDHYFATYPNAANKPGEKAFTAKPGTPKVNNLVTPLDVNNDFAPLTGVDLLTANPNKTNTGNGADATNPFRLGPALASTTDQGHNYQPEQLAYDGGAMDLFPKFTGVSPTGMKVTAPDPDPGKGMVMGYFDGNTLSALWSYAQSFAMNDNSWTSQFGPSTPGALNLIAGMANGMTSPNKDFSLFSASHAMADGQGGWTMIGDVDPVGDVCTTGPEQVLMSGKNIGDSLNAKNITWGAFMGGFDLTVVNPNGTTGCLRATDPTAKPFAFNSVDYIPHHAWFQYYPSTANPTHARPSAVAAIGSSKTADGKPEPANHNYDMHDFFEALSANNLPAVSFLKAPAYQDAHAGYSNPTDEQNYLISVVNAVQGSPFWASTAIILAYDDSDGWYDHQAPPIVNPSSLAAIGSPSGATDTIDQLNGVGMCLSTQFQQGKAAPATAMVGADGAKPVLGRCGYGTRLPFVVLSPFAKPNFVDHTLTDQSSVLRFIEDNWLGGARMSPGSFDHIAGTIENMFSFPAGASAADHEALAESRKLILDPATGLEPR